MNSPIDNFEPFEVVLKDGTPAVVRPIESKDAQALVKGLERLSYDSRRNRFFFNKTRFKEEELETLTTNTEQHLALVLGVLDSKGEEIDTVAVARCFRDPNDDGFAEVAITTVDEWQGLGIGTILIRTLAREARGAGITRWRAVFFRSNQLTEKLLQRVGEKVIQRGFGSGAVDTVYELYLPEGLEGEG